MQIGRPKINFQQYSAEPRPAAYPPSSFVSGPPPSYRSTTIADDSATFSSTESSALPAPKTSIKRRNSWSNLIESNENLCTKDSSFNTESLYTTKQTSNSSNIMMPFCYTLNGNNYQYLEKYNLNGRYAKYFTPFYVLNSAGDPIAISKLNLANCDSSCKLNGVKGKLPTNFSRFERINELRTWFLEPKNKPYTFILLLLTIAFGILTITLLLSNEQTIFREKSQNFSWKPPLIFRSQQGNSTIVKMYPNEHQARFEILGNLPIKNNYIAIYDFTARKIAIIDSTLKDNGRNLVCFLMNMNVSTMPDRYSLEIGAQNALKRKEQLHGWEEVWNFLPSSYFGNSSELFDPPIPECNDVRWILLNYTELDQRGRRCSDCYDFCLPELGIERDHLRAEAFLNIVRRNCFYFFVPEWRSFAAAYSGKQNEYDLERFNYGLSRINNDNGNRSTSSNGDVNYVNRLNDIQNVIGGIAQPITDQYRNFESKWISLQEIPQQSPPSDVSQMSNSASNMQSIPSATFQTISEKGNYRQSQHLPMIESNYTGSGNVRQQNGAFSSSNNIGQFSLPIKYTGQTNDYNAQIPIGQAFNGLSNTANNGSRSQQLVNDQGWITVG